MYSFRLLSLWYFIFSPSWKSECCMSGSATGLPMTLKTENLPTVSGVITVIISNASLSWTQHLRDLECSTEESSQRHFSDSFQFSLAHKNIHLPMMLTRQWQSFNSLKSYIQIIPLSFLFYCPVTRRDVRCLSENNSCTQVKKLWLFVRNITLWKEHPK